MRKSVGESVGAAVGYICALVLDASHSTSLHLKCITWLLTHQTKSRSSKLLAPSYWHP